MGAAGAPLSGCLLVDIPGAVELLQRGLLLAVLRSLAKNCSPILEAQVGLKLLLLS